MDLRALSGALLDYFVARMYHDAAAVRINAETRQCEIRRGDVFAPFSPTISPSDALSVYGDSSKIWDASLRERALRDCLRQHHGGYAVCFDIEALKATLCT